MNNRLTHDQVKEYYGKVLQSSEDLKTDACCTNEGLPDYLKSILSQVHDEVLTRYYGCGLVLPEQLTNTRILDLGSGSGRDVYALSALVGERGEVVGVDMTTEQLDIAREYRDFHAEQFGFAKPNTRFEMGYIEALDKLRLEAESFDIVVSNCVINLSPDKHAVLQQCYDLLKPGGEIYFSDVYAERRVPQKLIEDEELYGECISGALYWNDFLQLAKHCGFKDPRLVNSRPLMIDNERLLTKLEGRRFYSATYRLFKLDELELSNEDYGQTVRYLGTIDHHPEEFALDSQNTFTKGDNVAVSGNTWRMLQSTRFNPHFEFTGGWSDHRGIFVSADTKMPFSSDATETGSCC